MRSRVQSAAVAVAAPALILVSVAVALWPLLFDGHLHDPHPDLIPFWTPQYCFLGAAVAGGDLPLWNPHVMLGVPFASDPQSGWLNLPVMALFAGVRCDLAMRLLLVLYPVIAGGSIHAFLRRESVERPYAAVGGLVLALAMAGVTPSAAVPYLGTIAMTAVLLLSLSYLSRARSVASLVALAVVGAVVFGQVLAAHLTTGLLVAGVSTLGYAAARVYAAGREGRRRVVVAFATLLLLVPVVNLALILPRLAYVPRTSLGLGYETLRMAEAAMRGDVTLNHVWEGLRATWASIFLDPAGAFVGVLALLTSLAGLLHARTRALAVAFASVAVGSFALTLDATVRGLSGVASSVAWQQLLHNVPRLRLAIFLALPLLGAVGLQAWIRLSTLRRVAALLFGAIPLLALAQGVDWHTQTRLLLAASAAIAALVLWALGATAGRTWVRRWLPVIVGAQLVIAVFLTRAPLTGSLRTFVAPARTTADVAAASTRYVTVDPARWTAFGLRFHQTEEDAPSLAHQQSMINGGEEAQGYNPAQLLPYWRFVRAASQAPLRYNASYFFDPAPHVLDLLGVGLVIRPARMTVERGVPNQWVVERRAAPSRASVLRRVMVVARHEDALSVVLDPSFDSTASAVVTTRVPGTGPALPPGGETAAMLPTGDTDTVRIKVRTRTAGLLVVRNAYDPNWRATVDGEPAPVLRTDFLLQGVPLDAGTHDVTLTFEDPLVFGSLAASGGVILVVALLAAVLTARDRRRRA